MNAKRILTGLTALGIFLCILGVVFIGNGIRHHLLPVQNARILEIRDTGYIHGAGDDICNEHTEDVLVKTEDGQTAIVTVKSMDEQALPRVGDTIRIYGSEEHVEEFTSWYGKAGIWFGYGATCLFFGGVIMKNILSKGKE